MPMRLGNDDVEVVVSSTAPTPSFMESTGEADRERMMTKVQTIPMMQTPFTKRIRKCFLSWCVTRSPRERALQDEWKTPTNVAENLIDDFVRMKENHLNPLKITKSCLKVQVLGTKTQPTTNSHDDSFESAGRRA